MMPHPVLNLLRLKRQRKFRQRPSRNSASPLLTSSTHSNSKTPACKLGSKSIPDRLVSVKAEIAGLRSLATELVDSAYQNEVEVHATSKVRVQVAESLNKQITAALKG